MSKKKYYLLSQTLVPILTLFTSFTTLVCCAFPALFITLGMGATLAGLIGIVPWITKLSDYKLIIFGISGTLIVFGFLIQFFSRDVPCPVDEVKAKSCKNLRKFSWILLYISSTIFIIGFIFAFFYSKLIFL